jgi:hypothetical protein
MHLKRNSSVRDYPQTLLQLMMIDMAVYAHPLIDPVVSKFDSSLVSLPAALLSQQMAGTVIARTTS